jgi:hypothetical protein
VPGQGAESGHNGRPRRTPRRPTERLGESPPTPCVRGRSRPR